MKVKKYPIVPVPAPRQTRHDVWKNRPCVLRYRKFKHEVKKYGIEIPENGCHVTFIIPMTESWSDEKKYELLGNPVQMKRKGDVDNYVKALLDSIYDEDAHIWDIRGTKLWGHEGAIIIREFSEHEFVMADKISEMIKGKK